MTLEAEIGGLWFKTSPGKNLARPYHKEEAGHLVHAYCPNYVGGGDRKITV
jgi:hypothetical protein